MKVLFYSESCKFSSDLISKLKETSFVKDFQLINVDKNQIPSKIKVVPTIIDSEYKDLLEGKKAFEYIFNKKYFNNPTNNFLFWKDKNIPKPDIKEDKMANKFSNSLSSLDDNKDQTSDYVSIETKDEVKKIPKLNKNQLLRIRGRV